MNKFKFYYFRALFIILFAYFLSITIANFFINENSVKKHTDNSIKIELNNLIKIDSLSYKNQFNDNLKTLYLDPETNKYYLKNQRLIKLNSSSTSNSESCSPENKINSKIILVNKNELKKKGTKDDPIIFLDNYPFFSQSEILECYEIYSNNVKEYMKYNLLGNWYLTKSGYIKMIWIIGFIAVFTIIFGIYEILTRK